MARRSKPRTSRVNGTVWPIRWQDPGTVKAEDGAEAAGVTDNEKYTICMDNGLHPDKEAAVLLHELTHQVLYLYGVQMPDDLEETVADAIGQGFFAHLRENADFWNYITNTARPRPRRARKPPHVPGNETHR